jgi:hypothetical protein
VAPAPVAPAPVAPAAVDPTAVAPTPAPVAALPPPSPCSQPAEIQKLFMARCTVCHSAAMKSGNLDLETPGSRARMLNQPSTSCKGQSLAAADSTGVVIDKLTGAVPPNCGVAMPVAGLFPALNPDEVNCVRDWLRGR